ncbi:N-terminal acetyltransferase A, auxiliary subunit [Schizopora paradoxa]|uniref:N-terminal acetyltransferase A, auxiliary subunit n=1 Tax=Schizopora paradoxa TaxID=27342 RepID=A0A0H2RPH8_9AGAM|nr:N-terminal acetyltransferase A, auxiliary subunit [Schizopora paradoxa]
MPPKKPLASKEQHLFRELLSLYEARQLKKGLKTADQILKKAPDSGETMCMKGLILTHMGRREEGIDLVKKGIRLDLTSHICWHVFGLIQKAEKNYEEALKSYTQALRFDKENISLLQDAATLQTHLRNYEALQDTRELILKLRPNHRRHWILLALAYHLNGNPSDARKVLESYQKMLKARDIPDYDVEHSNVLLYQVRVIEDCGDFASALALLDGSAKSRGIVDRTAIMEYRARLLTKQGDTAEAEQAWRLLIEKNSDCLHYFRELFRIKNLPLDAVSGENREQAVALLLELSSQYPRSSVPARLLLDVSEGPEFEERVRVYVLDRLRRGIPSLFVDLKSLYANPSKPHVIENVTTQFRTEVESSLRSSSSPEGGESPTTLVWTLYFLAQHYSFLRRYEEAIETIDFAIEDTPTLPELYACKARILKRAGDLVGAVREIEEARCLDGQDRFLNTKSAKYHLRAGLREEAISLLGLFTKKDAASPSADLEDMQSTLYLLEDASCLYRLSQLGPSLKRYLVVQSIYDDMSSDQYDFHSYSTVRQRFTLEAYTSLLKWEDGLRAQPPFVDTALGIARILIAVHDDPALATSSTPSKRSDADKKAEKKAKKAALKVLDEVKKGTQNSSSNEDKGLEPPTAKDDDPTGVKALTASDGLEQAWKYIKPLVSEPLSLNRTDVLACAYDLSIRRRKYVLAAKSLLSAHQNDPENPETHLRVVDFKLKVSSLSPPPSETIQSLVNQTLLKVLPDEIALETLNSQYLQRHSDDPRAILAVADASTRIGTPLQEVEDTVFGILNPNVKNDVKSSLAACEFLNRIKSPRKDEFRSECDKHFPLSTMFKTAEELAGYKSQNGSAGGNEDEKEVVNA